MSTVAALLICSVVASGAGAGDDWQRVICLDEPDFSVTLLVKPSASPADGHFLGFEIDNKADEPLNLDTANYRFDDVQVADPAGQVLREQSLGRGNSYDLLWRDGQRPPEGARDDSVPPGITRRTRYPSAYAYALLGSPPQEGWMVRGRAHFSLAGRSTPPQGVPFEFRWLAPDEQGIEAMRQRLQNLLSEPQDWLYDAFLLRTLLADPRIAPAATLDQLLTALKKEDQSVRPALREHIDTLYPADERVIQFWLDQIRARDRLLMTELAASSQTDRRLIEPLMQWYREDRFSSHASHHILQILARHQLLMVDRQAIAEELAEIALEASPMILAGQLGPDGEYWRWHHELNRLVLTGDRRLVPRLRGFLGRKEVVIDASKVAMINNGVSTRACDLAYNAILDLLDRPGERLDMQSGGMKAILQRDEPEALAAEYERRDGLIAALEAELAGEAP